MPDLFFEEVFKEASVAEDSRTIQNVLLCGNVSKNGYKIPSAAFVSEQHVQSLYADKPVYLDHDDQPLKRSTRTIAGVVRNPRYINGRPYGDVECLATENGNTLLALGRSRPKGIGMSHVAAYEPNKALKSRKTDTVEQVVHVESVDVVVNPATTKSFHEDTRVPDTQDALDVYKEQNTAYKAEVEQLKEDLKAKTQELQIAVESLRAKEQELETLQQESTSLKETIQKHEDRLALEQRREEVRKELKDAGLDPANAVICSESFLNSCVCESDSEKRAALIADRKALLSLSSESTSVKTFSTQRKAEQTDTFNAADILKNSGIFN